MAKRKTAPSASKQGDGAKAPKKPRAKKVGKEVGIPTATNEDFPTLSRAETSNSTEPSSQEPATDSNSIQGAPITDNHSDNLLGPSEFIPKKKHQVGLGWFPDMDPEERAKKLRHYEEHGTFEPSDQTQIPPNALRTTEGETRSQPRNIDANHSVTQEANTQVEDSPDSGKEQSTTQLDSDTSQGIAGDVSLSVAETVAVYAETQQNPAIPSRARMSGESRPSYWESMRKTARAAGLPRGQGPGTAYEWATVQAEREYAAEIAPLSPEPPEPEPIVEPVIEPSAADPAPENSPIGENLEVAPTPIASDQGVPGLGTMPDSWGTLPANASLQVEISWVSANRLRVRDGHGVDLSKALSPAPSYSALSWLETSILFPSKFADISVKATANQDDERESIRREKLSIEEIRGLLAEMLEG